MPSFDAPQCFAEAPGATAEPIRSRCLADRNRSAEEHVMSTTGLPVFDHTLQETNLWLKALMDRLQTDDRHVAYLALKATLHALRDRVGPENAVHLAAQLPMLIRGLYYEGWRMAASRTKERTRAAFLEHVRVELPRGSTIDPDLAARAVFAVMWEKIDMGEVGKVMELLPPELQDLWR
jgi:uncharacterized protein (DUF2267 family)